MQGFLIYDYSPRFKEAEECMTKWLKTGQLKYKEDIMFGIEAMPKALTRLYEGKNYGKQIVKVAQH
jgi:NADPH-dependent curcumin reductase CurA